MCLLGGLAVRIGGVRVGPRLDQILDEVAPTAAEDRHGERWLALRIARVRVSSVP